VSASRRFLLPWTFEDHNNACVIVRDANGLAVAYVYYEEEPGRRTAANLMTKEEARRIAANIAKLPGYWDGPLVSRITGERPGSAAGMRRADPVAARNWYS
jgi:endo-1,4-beta-D-glucanase Y